MSFLNRMLILALCLGLVACGDRQPADGPSTETPDTPGETPHEMHGQDEAPAAEDADEPQTDAGEAVETDADAETVEVRITGNDQMQFDIDRFTVQAGQTVRLTLEHVGQLPAAAMGHNVVVLQADEQPVSFGQEVLESGGSPDNEYLPEDMRDRTIAFTEMIGGGETTTVEFEAPEPGEYPFVCTFPGHFAMMQGVMVVE